MNDSFVARNQEIHKKKGKKVSEQWSKPRVRRSRRTEINEQH